ncbi:hypothetical protein [Streptomyces sp. NPDC049949]|uniref:hypothetical protein n=1 Tax=Streptomyces sp. NPDC049949 TaxID=3154627 RepID=UPI00342CF278
MGRRRPGDRAAPAPGGGGGCGHRGQRAGETTGYASLPGEETRAVRRDIAGRVGDRGSPEGSYGEPTAINDRGTVVDRAVNATGGVAGDVGSSRTWPLRWRAVVRR